MDIAILALRILLAAVFLIAGVSKALDRPGSRRAAEDFGLPPQLAAMVTIALPGVEIAVAVGLVVQPTASPGALAALLLLAIFVVAIARLMRRGVVAECHCFGQLEASVVGRSTLLRNIGLGSMAAVVLVAGPGTSLATLAGEDLALLATSLSTATLGALALRFWRENRALRARRRTSEGLLGGLAPGSPVPELELQNLEGGLVSVARITATGTPTLFVQVGLGCGPCHDLMPELVRWRRVLSDELSVVIVSSGDLEPNRLFAASFEVPGLLVSRGQEFAAAFDVDITPSAVYIDERGRVAAPPAMGAGAIESLVRSVRSQPSATSAAHSRPLSTPVADGPRQA